MKPRYHPMLAGSAASPFNGEDWLFERKWDGIRAIAYVDSDLVLLSRNNRDITRQFPELAELTGLAPGTVLDGEIVVMTAEGRPRPFSAIQPRLKKSEPDSALIAQFPVRYLVYDLLLEGDEPLLALPFVDRRARLAQWAAHAPSPPVVLHDSRPLATGGADPKPALDAEFDAARARGFEGLVLKRLDAPYAAGVRGFAWLKVKKAFATLDVVIVAAERGHGKRAGVLSDYTFAVWKDGELQTVGKAYSGLTDEEIRTMTERLRAMALADERRGWMPVRPEIVLEVAFDGIQRSDRHSSGYALRFPRIARIRDDKRADEADTVETVQRLYDAQIASGHREEAPAPKKKGGRKSGRRPDVRQKSKQLKLFDDGDD